MADRDVRPRVPRAKVDVAPAEAPLGETYDQVEAADEAEPATTGERVEGKARESSHNAEADAPKRDGHSAARARESVRTWLHETFPGHEHAAIWGFIGFLVALLFFAIGFWRALVVVLLVVVGVAFGQMLDGDPKIINTLRRIFSGDNGR